MSFYQQFSWVGDRPEAASIERAPVVYQPSSGKESPEDALRP